MKPTIAIIDDDLTTLTFLQFYFQKTYKVKIFSFPEQALDWLEYNMPELIICDIQIPEIDGFQCLKSIRNNPLNSMTPVIMLSGEESSDTRIKCFNMGADDYLLKPFNPEELKIRINKRIDSSFLV